MTIIQETETRDGLFRHFRLAFPEANLPESWGDIRNANKWIDSGYELIAVWSPEVRIIVPWVILGLLSKPALNDQQAVSLEGLLTCLNVEDMNAS